MRTVSPASGMGPLERGRIQPLGARRSVSFSDGFRYPALRGRGWLAASDSAGGDGIPLQATAEQEPTPTVLNVAVAPDEATDLLNQQVDRFGRSLERAAGDERRGSRPATRRACERGG